MEIRPLTTEQQTLLEYLNADLQELFENPFQYVCIAGGYLDASRPANDVDFFIEVLDGDMEDDIEIMAELEGILYNKGFKIHSMPDEATLYETSCSGELKYIIRTKHKLFGDLECQFICSTMDISTVIEDRFPLSIQQVAWFPNGSFFGDDLFHSVHESPSPDEFSTDIIVFKEHGEKYVEKYKEYYPNAVFISYEEYYQKDHILPDHLE